MSNVAAGLSRIDSRSIGEAEAAESVEVLESDALLAARDAGIEPELVKTVASRTVVGRFAATGMSGYIVGDTLRDQSVVERALQRLERELAAEKITPEHLINVCDAISKLVNSRSGNRAILLKAVEISAARKGKKNNQANAPQRINAKNVFTGPTQINTPTSTIGEPKPAG